MPALPSNATPQMTPIPLWERLMMSLPKNTNTPMAGFGQRGLSPAPSPQMSTPLDAIINMTDPMIYQQMSRDPRAQVAPSGGAAMPSIPQREMAPPMDENQNAVRGAEYMIKKTATQNAGAYQQAEAAQGGLSRIERMIESYLQPKSREQKQSEYMMRLFGALAAGKSPYALENVGTAFNAANQGLVAEQQQGGTRMKSAIDMLLDVQKAKAQDEYRRAVLDERRARAAQSNRGVAAPVVEPTEMDKYLQQLEELEAQDKSDATLAKRYGDLNLAEEQAQMAQRVKRRLAERQNIERMIGLAKQGKPAADEDLPIVDSFGRMQGAAIVGESD